MSKRESLLRHSAIIRKLKCASATLKEIEEYLERESEILAYDLRVSSRTFQRDIEDIRSLYQVHIRYDQAQKKYLVEDQDDNGLNFRMLEAFETFNALNISAGLSEHLDFEKRKSSGLENMHGFLHAIRNRLQLNFDYQSYSQDAPALRKTNPYFLKEFKGRWYLIAKDLRDEKVKTYALDRIQSIDITKKKYSIPADYRPKEMFENCFGIISAEEGSIPEEVVLSFTPFQGKYIKSLPLHQSQKILIDNEAELRIQLKIHIAFDFVKELLSYGNTVKILNPLSLVDEIRDAHQEAFERYQS